MYIYIYILLLYIHIHAYTSINPYTYIDATLSHSLSHATATAGRRNAESLRMLSGTPRQSSTHVATCVGGTRLQSRQACNNQTPPTLQRPAASAAAAPGIHPGPRGAHARTSGAGWHLVQRSSVAARAMQKCLNWHVTSFKDKELTRDQHQSSCSASNGHLFAC